MILMIAEAVPKVIVITLGTPLSYEENRLYE